MITTKGKQIIAKYMLGQASNFGNYIAIGCGVEPLGPGETFSGNLKINENMYFEMERFPVISKSFYKDPTSGNINLVFKAEIPSDQRYKITEIGLFPSKNDESNASGDSKKVAVFLSKEGWRSIKPSSTDSTITIQTGSIDTGSGAVINNGIAFVTDSNSAWSLSPRYTRNEVPRFLTESLIIDGNYSTGTSSGTSFIFDSSASYVQNPSIFLNLSQNSLDDKIKIAMSVIPKNTETSTLPPYVHLKIELSNQTNSGDQKRAYAQFNYVPTTNYFVISEALSNFIKQEPDFSWANITSIKIWVNAENNLTEEFLVLLDGIRIDAINRTNPLYSLVAQNVVLTADGTPILKKENTSSYIEFKMDLGS